MIRSAIRLAKRLFRRRAPKVKLTPLGRLRQHLVRYGDAPRCVSPDVFQALKDEYASRLVPWFDPDIYYEAVNLGRANIIISEGVPVMRLDSLPRNSIVELSPRTFFFFRALDSTKHAYEMTFLCRPFAEERDDG